MTLNGLKQTYKKTKKKNEDEAGKKKYRLRKVLEKEGDQVVREFGSITPKQEGQPWCLGCYGWPCICK